MQRLAPGHPQPFALTNREVLDAIVLADHAKYVQVHQQAVAVVDRLAQVRQVVSIDEMECELTGRWRERDRAVALAQQIKAALLAEVGVGRNWDEAH